MTLKAGPLSKLVIKSCWLVKRSIINELYYRLVYFLESLMQLGAVPIPTLEHMDTIYHVNIYKSSYYDTNTI
jgi:hypothetical protein